MTHPILNKPVVPHFAPFDGSMRVSNWRAINDWRYIRYHSLWGVAVVVGKALLRVTVAPGRLLLFSDHEEIPPVMRAFTVHPRRRRHGRR